MQSGRHYILDVINWTILAWSEVTVFHLWWTLKFYPNSRTEQKETASPQAVCNAHHAGAMSLRALSSLFVHFHFELCIM